MDHVRKVPSKRQAVVDDDTKLNLLLALEENPITPARPTRETSGEDLTRDGHERKESEQRGALLFVPYELRAAVCTEAW
ncbi:hypothetical protein NQ318_021824 [Aromia moschata]|uniref:Uncharacterized protein n=1 Tax=Aromia moschata TaxID=1265417 RepID=A0AAV8Z6X8_9CUCU|nr:hypothetical protein NQ318_021824 [Aromia moschata]